MHVRRTLAAAAAFAAFVGTPVVAQHEQHAMPEGHGEHSAEVAAALDHMTEVLELNANVREAIAGDIEAIVTLSQRVSEMQQQAEGASAEHLELIHSEMEDMQEQLHTHHDAVVAQLNDEQGEKFTKLLHEHLMKLHHPNTDGELHQRRHR